MARLSGTSDDMRALVTGEQPAAGLAAQALWNASSAADEAQFLASTLKPLAASAGAEMAAVVVARDGQWSVAGHTGNMRPLPTELLAEALDRDAPLENGEWQVAPLNSRRTPGELLLVHGARSSAGAHALGGQLASILAHSLEVLRARLDQARRLERLEAILAIAASWSATNEMEPLLNQMAAAATRLLHADRASIFLWDRASHTLVGRPALGIAEGELRIDDRSGIVGQVVQSGQPRRVNSALDQREINRDVDRALGYQTKTLLCVPLRSPRGELFGAFEVINKREGVFTDEDEEALTELASHAAIALDNTQQLEQLLTTHRHLVDQAAEGVQLIGHSPAIEALRSTIKRVAGTELAILILGENGTGKEVISQSIHYLSRRRDQPFVAVNCAAISETLLESELFGHEKGAFTDAHEARRGKFELASGGTLFLDEIGDLSPGGQAKLLRVLEEKVVVRVGGSTSIHTDARVIAATNQNLAEMVRQKRFRQDLFFRLNVVSLELPPLRDRDEDVLLLAEHFIADFCRKAHRKPLKLSAAARKRLLSHSWPGNVRELRNLIERLAYLLPGERIEAEDLAFILSPGEESPLLVALDQPLANATDRFQAEYIKTAIQRSRGNMSDAADRLGLHRSNLYRKMRQLGMQAEDKE